MDTQTAPGLRAEENRVAQQARVVALIVASGLFMQGLDSTIIVTALPTMAKAFGVRASDLSIGITAYMLATAAALPLTGWIADRLGARNVFAGAVVTFTVASLLCALSPNLAAFTAARVLQGIGGGLVTAVGRLVVMRNTDNRNMLASIALMVWPSLAAPILGPLLGGLIVTHAPWPWIFLVNLPIGLLGLVLTLAFIPDIKAKEPPPLDVVGFLLATGAMIGLAGGLELVVHSRTPWPPLALFAAGVALAVAAWRRFSRSPRPFIPLEAMTVQTFATANFWGGWPFRMTVGGAPFVLPLLFQVGFGFSPVRAGLLLLGYFFGNLAMKPFTTFVLRAGGLRPVLVWNTVICTLATLGFLLLNPALPDIVVMGLMAIAGASRSMQFTALESLSYCDIPQAKRSGATTLWGVANQLAQVMGVAIPAIVLGVLPRLRGESVVSPQDFVVVIFVLAGLSILPLPAFLRLPRDAGADVTGHRAR